jgi:hypothetical protein
MRRDVRPRYCGINIPSIKRSPFSIINRVKIISQLFSLLLIQRAHSTSKYQILQLNKFGKWLLLWNRTRLENYYFMSRFFEVPKATNIRWICVISW